MEKVNSYRNGLSMRLIRTGAYHNFEMPCILVDGLTKFNVNLLCGVVISAIWLLDLRTLTLTRRQELGEFTC